QHRRRRSACRVAKDPARRARQFPVRYRPRRRASTAIAGNAQASPNGREAAQINYMARPRGADKGAPPTNRQICHDGERKCSLVQRFVVTRFIGFSQKKGPINRATTSQVNRRFFAAFAPSPPRWLRRG